MRLRRALVQLVAVVLLVQPVLVSAAGGAVDSIVNANQETVTRMQFLNWTFQVLNIQKADGCKLKYTRVPKGNRAVLCTAQAYGAFDLFENSKNYAILRKPVSRGEALEILTMFMGASGNADVSAFTDVKTERMREAVMNALAYKWMTPARANLFGVARPLTGSESLALFKAATHDTDVETMTVNTNSTKLPKQEILEAVWAIIERDYLFKENVDSEEALYGAIEGMVKSLNDPYTTFMRPTIANNFGTQLQGEISGIGAHVEEKDGNIVIVSTIPTSPAQKAGLLSGDIITDVDATSVRGFSVDKAVGMIRGPKGTTVKLKLERNGSPLEVSIVRETITIPEIKVSWQGDIAIVELVQFGEITNTRIRSIFTDINNKKPRGVILDLRNNPGGLLSGADTVVSNFMPQGTVVAQVRDRDGKIEEEKTAEGPTLDATVKVVLLVNEGSASASEIVAGALQDYKRATLIGTKTFGKGTVQEVLGFVGGEALKLTRAQWLTPLGRTINKVGIVPDTVVEAGDRDMQLQKAIELLR